MVIFTNDILWYNNSFKHKSNLTLIKFVEIYP